MTENEFDERDALLFFAAQEGLPLTPEPFTQVGERIGASELDVLDGLRRFRKARLIRALAARFSAHSLGYQESLVAFHVPPDRLDDAGARVLEHPGVIDCHGCRHDYSLWFSIVVPPGSELAPHIDKLGSMTRMTAHRSFPMGTVFKEFGPIPLNGWEGEPALLPESALAAPQRAAVPAEPLSPASIRLITLLQEDLEISRRPFDAPAAALGITTEALLGRLDALVKTGRMAGIGAVAEPARVGLPIGAWVLWAVPASRLAETARELSRDPRVLHCSSRPAFPAWPYTVYTWMRVSSTADLAATVNRMAVRVGVSDTLLLAGVREFGSRFKRYFIPEDWQWEKAHLGPRSL